MRETDCPVSAMKAALFPILRRQLLRSRPLTNTVLSASDRTQHASLLHKHRSVPDAARLIQCDRFSMIHSARTQTLGRDGCLEGGWTGRERVPAAFVAAGSHRAAREGERHALGRTDRAVSRTETLADEHMVASPKTMACSAVRSSDSVDVGSSCPAVGAGRSLQHL